MVLIGDTSMSSGKGVLQMSMIDVNVHQQRDSSNTRPFFRSERRRRRDAMARDARPIYNAGQRLLQQLAALGPLVAPDCPPVRDQRPVVVYEEILEKLILALTKECVIGRTDPVSEALDVLSMEHNWINDLTNNATSVSLCLEGLLDHLVYADAKAARRVNYPRVLANLENLLCRQVSKEPPRIWTRCSVGTRCIASETPMGAFFRWAAATPRSPCSYTWAGGRGYSSSTPIANSCL